MPITQSRMLSIIDAALDYQQAHERVTQAVRDAFNRILVDPNTDKNSLIFYEFQCAASMAEPAAFLEHHVDSAVAIATEHQHFKSVSARNRYEAIRQARKRGRLPNPLPLPAEFSQSRAPNDNAPFTMKPANYHRAHTVIDAVNAELARPRDPRVTAEDEARFAAQVEEDRKRDAGFGMHMFQGLSDEQQAKIDAFAEREAEIQKHAARSEELAHASKIEEKD